ncbi:hypothetical protein GUF49_07600, partial [Xanthomonas citri pv. citri]|nr:hypothetical protein [Xanthomonas citri pv. citri]
MVYFATQERRHGKSVQRDKDRELSKYKLDKEHEQRDKDRELEKLLV